MEEVIIGGEFEFINQLGLSLEGHFCQQFFNLKMVHTCM